MPHHNAIEQLKKYGKSFSDLDRLIDKISSADSWTNRDKATELNDELLRFSDTHDLSKMLATLSSDKYAHNRELAAATLFYIWQAWKFTIRLNGPTTKSTRKDYELKQHKYSDDLDWSIDLVHELLNDRSIGPCKFAILAAREICEINEKNAKQFREKMEKLCYHPSSSVRLEAVRALTTTFPTNQEALSILSGAALNVLIDKTYDNSAEVRDWSCFILTNNVENINQKVEKAFLDAIAREGEDSDVFCEAVVGLARIGNPIVFPIICNNLKRDIAGSIWIEAAEQSQYEECILELVNTYQRYLELYPDYSNFLSEAEDVICDWNLSF